MKTIIHLNCDGKDCEYPMNEETWQEQFETKFPYHDGACLYLQSSENKCGCWHPDLVAFASSLLDVQKQEFLAVLEGLRMNEKPTDGTTLYASPDDGFNEAVDRLNIKITEAKEKL